MNQEQERQFKESLEAENWHPIQRKVGPDMFSKLENACRKTIIGAGGALWYSEFVEPLGEHILDLHNNGLYCTSRNSSISLDEIEARDGKKNLFLNTAKNRLVSLRQKPADSFTINTIYQFMRKKFSLGREDKISLELSSPMDNREAYLLGGKILNLARFAQNRYMGRNEIMKTSFDAPFDPEVSYSESTSRYSVWKREIGSVRTMVGNLPVAYTDMGAAFELTKDFIQMPVKEARIVYFTLKEDNQF